MAITPYLLYADVAAARTFLRTAFGFRNYGATRKTNGRLSHAAVKMGDDVVMMGCPGAQYKNPRKLGGATQMLYVNVPDVKKHFARAQKAGAKIIEEPQDTKYGHLRYGAADPEGHQWYFAQKSRRKRG
jgi:uncharacterized glyoxalase superfamily protein PhnB